MTRVLMIGLEEKNKLRAAYERAKAKPILWESVRKMALADPSKSYVSLADRPPEADRPQSECVRLPVGFMVCISFEEQPVGMLAHFSISIDRPGKLPNKNAVAMILDEFAFHPSTADATWVEEFMFDGKPGGIAINLVYVVAPRVEAGTVQ